MRSKSGLIISAKYLHYKAPYQSDLWGNRPMTLGRLAREAPLTEAELAEKERKRRQIIAAIMAKRDKAAKEAEEVSVNKI